MKVVDTSAWLEWLARKPTARTLAPLLPDRASWIVPTIVQFELAKYLAREGGETEVDRMLAFSNTCIVSPLSTAIAVSAAEAAKTYRLPMADAIIYATARAYRADLLTCDAHFKDLDGVVYIAKDA